MPNGRLYNRSFSDQTWFAMHAPSACSKIASGRDDCSRYVVAHQVIWLRVQACIIWLGRQVQLEVALFLVVYAIFLLLVRFCCAPVVWIVGWEKSRREGVICGGASRNLTVVDLWLFKGATKPFITFFYCGSAVFILWVFLNVWFCILKSSLCKELQKIGIIFACTMFFCSLFVDCFVGRLVGWLVVKVPEGAWPWMPAPVRWSEGATLVATQGATLLPSEGATLPHWLLLRAPAADNWLLLHVWPHSNVYTLHTVGQRWSTMVHTNALPNSVSTLLYNDTHYCLHTDTDTNTYLGCPCPPTVGWPWILATHTNQKTIQIFFGTFLLSGNLTRRIWHILRLTWWKLAKLVNILENWSDWCYCWSKCKPDLQPFLSCLCVSIPLSSLCAPAPPQCCSARACHSGRLSAGSGAVEEGWSGAASPSVPCKPPPHQHAALHCCRKWPNRDPKMILSSSSFLYLA